MSAAREQAVQAMCGAVQGFEGLPVSLGAALDAVPAEVLARYLVERGGLEDVATAHQHGDLVVVLDTHQGGGDW